MDEFMMYLEDERVHLEAKEAELKTADRRDEGSMEKVKSNIYGMCLAIYRTVVRQSAPEDVKDVYLKRLEEFPEKWETFLKKAEASGDAKRAMTERIKLEALQEIRRRFLSFRG